METRFAAFLCPIVDNLVTSQRIVSAPPLGARVRLSNRWIAIAVLSPHRCNRKTSRCLRSARSGPLLRRGSLSCLTPSWAKRNFSSPDSHLG